MSVEPNDVVAYVVFAPANPVVVADTNIRNMAGQDGGGLVVVGAPARIAAGRYQGFINGQYVRTELSINAVASTAVAGGIGTDRSATVLLSAAGVNETQYNVMIRDDVGVLTDDTTQVEVVFRRLPPKQN